jgi:phosphonate transport system ATP-binding protein
LISSPRSRQRPIGEVLLDGVTVSFDGAPALKDVGLRVETGERLAVIGASGAGKSTLFRALTRSVALDGGRVAIGGGDLYGLSKRQLRELRREIGTIYQSYNLVPQLPAGINAALGDVGSMGRLGTLRTLLAGPGPELSARVIDALARVGLEGKARSRTADLSGGQQQRIAVARLLVQRPGLILADEPFAAVDPVTTERVLGALIDLNRGGATLLANLHDVEIARRFPRVVALREGRVVFDGDPARLTGEQLAGIYAGDVQGASQSGEDPVRHCREDTARIATGRDGVSAH